MSYGPLRFGDGSDAYIFPQTVTKWTCNFADLRAPVDELPGVSGGIDVFGASPSPSVIGAVTLTFWLLVPTPADMTAAKDAVFRMASAGKRKLWFRPFNTELNDRWCNARIERISMPENAEVSTEKSQEVTLYFKVAESRWYSANQTAAVVTWGGGALWNDPESIYGGTPGTPFVGGSTLEIDVTTIGSAYTLPIVELSCDTGETMTNPVVRRVANDNILEEIGYEGTISAGDTLTIDARQLSAKLNSTDVYNDITYTRAHWLSIAPGTNHFEISTDGPDDAGNVRIKYDEAYY